MGSRSAARTSKTTPKENERIDVEGLESFFLDDHKGLLAKGLNLKEAVYYYGDSKSEIREKIKTGEIPAIRIPDPEGPKWCIFPDGVPSALKHLIPSEETAEAKSHEGAADNNKKQKISKPEAEQAKPKTSARHTKKAVPAQKERVDKTPPKASTPTTKQEASSTIIEGNIHKLPGQASKKTIKTDLMPPEGAAAETESYEVQLAQKSENSATAQAAQPGAVSPIEIQVEEGRVEQVRVETAEQAIADTVQQTATETLQEAATESRKNPSEAKAATPKWAQGVDLLFPPLEISDADQPAKGSKETVETTTKHAQIAAANLLATDISPSDSLKISVQTQTSLVKSVLPAISSPVEINVDAAAEPRAASIQQAQTANEVIHRFYITDSTPLTNTLPLGSILEALIPSLEFKAEAKETIALPSPVPTFIEDKTANSFETFAAIKLADGKLEEYLARLEQAALYSDEQNPSIQSFDSSKILEDPIADNQDLESSHVYPAIHFNERHEELLVEHTQVWVSEDTALPIIPSVRRVDREEASRNRAESQNIEDPLALVKFERVADLMQKVNELDKALREANYKNNYLEARLTGMEDQLKYLSQNHYSTKTWNTYAIIIVGLLSALALIAIRLFA